MYCEAMNAGLAESNQTTRGTLLTFPTIRLTDGSETHTQGLPVTGFLSLTQFQSVTCDRDWNQTFSLSLWPHIADM